MDRKTLYANIQGMALTGKTEMSQSHKTFTHIFKKIKEVITIYWYVSLGY